MACNLDGVVYVKVKMTLFHIKFFLIKIKNMDFLKFSRNISIEISD